MNNKFTNQNSLTDPVAKKQGSVIMVALFFTVAVSMVTLSFLTYAMTDYKLEKRTHENTRLLYLAEGGADLAVWSIKNGNWSNWTVSETGTDMYRFSYSSENGGARTEQQYILVRNYATKPVIFSEANCIYGNGNRLSKQIRVRYNLGGGIGAGIIARNNLIFKVNPEINAYDSAVGLPSSTNRSDQVVIASASDQNDMLVLEKKTDVYGYLATGGGDPYLAAGSTLTGEETEAGVTVDMERISYDFTYDFPEPVQPDWSGAINTLEVKNSTVTIGTSGSTPTLYSLTDLSLTGNGVLEVVGPVKMYLRDGFSTLGTAHIEIAPGGSLEIYTPGDVDVLGTGIVNMNSSPSKFKLHGTSKSSQNVDISGTGDIAGVVYAPNANVTLGGTGGLLGALTGNNITFNATGAFSYDIQLAGSGDDNIGISSWHELIKSTDRINIKSFIASL